MSTKNFLNSVVALSALWRSNLIKEVEYKFRLNNLIKEYLGE